MTGKPRRLISRVRGLIGSLDRLAIDFDATRAAPLADKKHPNPKDDVVGVLWAEAEIGMVQLGASLTRIEGELQAKLQQRWRGNAAAR